MFNIFHFMHCTNLMLNILRSIALIEAHVKKQINRWIIAPVFKSVILKFSRNLSISLARESILDNPQRKRWLLKSPVIIKEIWICSINFSNSSIRRVRLLSSILHMWSLFSREVATAIAYKLVRRISLVENMFDIVINTPPLA